MGVAYCGVYGVVTLCDCGRGECVCAGGEVAIVVSCCSPGAPNQHNTGAGASR